MLLFYMVRKENQNMKIKKLLAAVLSLAMGVSMMTACGSSDNSSKAEKDSSATENTQKHTNDPMTVTTAKDLVAQMKVGWNLGNTMDATGGSGLDAETSWGNVETTKLMIDQVKDAGFNVFRLPVSWSNVRSVFTAHSLSKVFSSSVEEKCFTQSIKTMKIQLGMLDLL